MALNRQNILQTALAMADEQGIEGLSMRAIAKRLNVGTMSLYTHVHNKDDLLMGMTDLVVQSLQPPKGPWRQALRSMAIDINQVLLKHPWATQQMMAGQVGPARLAMYDQILGILREAGFDKAQARRGFLAIDAHILGFSQQESALPPPAQRAEAASYFLQMLDRKQTPHLVEMVEELVASTEDAAYQTTFLYVLDLILQGLEEERLA